MYDLKETHHYDHHNTFWDRSRHLQNNNSRCLKQLYDSLNDEYQKNKEEFGFLNGFTFFFLFFFDLKHTII